MLGDLTTTAPIMVVGTGRSGTSAVAGVLHFLGVDMGGPFMRAPEDNPYGTFEDREFMALNDRALHGQIQKNDWLENLSKIEKKNAGHLWGRKDPATAYFLNELAPRGYRFVWCLRNRQDTVNSYVKCYRTSHGYDENRAREIVKSRTELLAEHLPQHRTLKVKFETLIKDPESTVKLINDSLWLGATDSQLNLATQHIRRHKHG
jgi:hypothetical protein